MKNIISTTEKYTRLASLLPLSKLDPFIHIFQNRIRDIQFYFEYQIESKKCEQNLFSVFGNWWKQSENIFHCFKKNGTRTCLWQLPYRNTTGFLVYTFVSRTHYQKLERVKNSTCRSIKREIKWHIWIHLRFFFLNMIFPLTLIKVSLNPEFGKLLIERKVAYRAIFLKDENSYHKWLLQCLNKIPPGFPFAEIDYRSTQKKKKARPQRMINIT